MISEHQLIALANLCNTAEFELTSIFTHPEAVLNDKQIELIAQIKKMIDQLRQILYDLQN